MDEAKNDQATLESLRAELDAALRSYRETHHHEQLQLLPFVNQTTFAQREYAKTLDELLPKFEAIAAKTGQSDLIFDAYMYRAWAKI